MPASWRQAQQKGRSEVRSDLSGIIGELQAISVVEFKEAEEIVDRRAIEWNVRVLRRGDGIGEVVTAPTRDGGKVPVVLDELQDRNVIGVFVRDVAGLGET